VAGVAKHAIVRDEQLAEDRQQCLGQRRQPGAPALFEKFGADLPLEVAHRRGNRGLRAECAGRGGAKAAGGRRDDELANLLNAQWLGQGRPFRCFYNPKVQFGKFNLLKVLHHTKMASSSIGSAA
jgi:hypothetical protein